MHHRHTLPLAMAALIAAAPLTAQAPSPDGDPPAPAAQLRIGLGYFDVLSRAEPAAAADITYRVGEPWLWVIAPELGAMVSADGSAYGFGGLYLPVDLGPRVAFLSSFAVGAYTPGGGLDLGHPIAFRSAIGLDVQVGDQATASLLFYHLSNASLGDINPGTEVLALGYTAAVGGPRREPGPRRPVPALDPAEPGFWILSAATLATAWRLDAELRRDEPGSGPAVLESLASAGHGIGGRAAMGTGLVSAVALSQLTDWPAERDRVLRVFAGAVASGVTVEAIKTTVGRGRPRDAGDRYAFQPFTRDNAWLSFPSGHATAGFAVAAAIDQEFDLGPWAWLGYGLAGAIAWSRVYQDAHWTSDTVAGAITGIAAARATVAWLQRGKSGPAGDAAGISLGIAEGAPALVITLPAP